MYFTIGKAIIQLSNIFYQICQVAFDHYIIRAREMNSSNSVQRQEKNQNLINCDFQ